jgi:alpha-N-acetylglucosamine transferase
MILLRLLFVSLLVGLSFEAISLAEFKVLEEKAAQKLNKLKVLKKGDPLQKSPVLTKFATQEAKRLAKLGALELPNFNFDESYLGNSRLIEIENSGRDKKTLGKYFLISLFVI